MILSYASASNRLTSSKAGCNFEKQDPSLVFIRTTCQHRSAAGQCQPAGKPARLEESPQMIARLNNCLAERTSSSIAVPRRSRGRELGGNFYNNSQGGELLRWFSAARASNSRRKRGERLM